MKRGHGPVLEITPGGELEYPFADGEGDWYWIVRDAFGTRMDAIAAVFINQLLNLCSSSWDEETQEWVPDQDEITTILNIISATKPKNEAEAVLAAQFAATHMITMKVAERAYKYPYDTKTLSAYAKLVRASAAQAEAMTSMKGKRRTTRQSIAVRHEKHIHHHQHVHLEGGGPKNERQPDAANIEPGVANPGAATVEGVSALPSPQASGRVVRIPSREGQESLPHARRG